MASTPGQGGSQQASKGHERKGNGNFLFLLGAVPILLLAANGARDLVRGGGSIADIMGSLSLSEKVGPKRVTTQESGTGSDPAVPYQAVSWAPRVFKWPGFLSEEECEHIKNVSTPHLKRSKVVDAQTGGEKTDPIRTSKGTFLPRKKDPVLQRIEERVALFTGLPLPHQEDLQVLSYGSSEQYYDHMDTLGAKNDGGAGERTMSVLMYLEDVTSGGETVFPKGSSYADPAFAPSPSSLSKASRFSFFYFLGN